MTTVLATIIVFCLAVGLLALGTFWAGRGLSASCGGGKNGACAVCTRRTCKRGREDGQ